MEHIYYKIRKCHHLFLELLNASHAVLELRREPDALLLDALLLRHLLLDSLRQLFLLVRLHRHISNVILYCILRCNLSYEYDRFT